MRATKLRSKSELLTERARRSTDSVTLERRFKARWRELGDIQPLVEPTGPPTRASRPDETNRSSLPRAFRVSDRCGMYAGAILGAGEPAEALVRTEVTAAVSGGSLAEAVRLMTSHLPFEEASRIRATIIAGAPTHEFVRRAPSGKGFVLSAGAEYERWADRWFEHFGHGTWATLRRDHGSPALDALSEWDYRLNVAITAIAFPWRVGRELIEQQKRAEPYTFSQLCMKKYRTNGIRFRQLLFPRDARLLGMSNEDVDRMRVSEMVATSGAHPFAFEARLRWDDVRARRGEEPPVFALMDGGIVNRPNPFRRDVPPPLPIIQVAMGCRDRHLRDEVQMRQLLERDSKLYPWAIHHRAGPTRLGSLEMDRVTGRDRLAMYVLATARASLDMETLPAYLESFTADRRALAEARSIRQEHACGGIPAFGRNFVGGAQDWVLDRVHEIRHGAAPGVHAAIDAIMSQPTMAPSSSPRALS